MSYSANHINRKNYLKDPEKGYLDKDFRKSINYKRESSKKDISRLNIATLKFKCAQSGCSNSTINTNISQIKEKKDDYGYFSYPIKPIIEDSFEKSFIHKRKLAYKSCSIINKKVISFQNQNNKEIMEFSLFDDSLIFKDINKSYLQEEYSDDGSDSSEEKINGAKLFLSQEIDDSIKKLSKSLQKNRGENLLSRRMRFKNEEN